MFLLLVLGSIPSSILWVFFWCSISFFFNIFSVFFFINFWPSTCEYTQNALVLKEKIFILQIYVSYMPVCSVMSYYLQHHDNSPPDFSVLGIFQTRILEWVAMFSSRESSWPRDQTHISCIVRWTLYHSADICWCCPVPLLCSIFRRIISLSSISSTCDLTSTSK